VFLNKKPIIKTFEKLTQLRYPTENVRQLEDMAIQMPYKTLHVIVQKKQPLHVRDLIDLFFSKKENYMFQLIHNCDLGKFRFDYFSDGRHSLILFNIHEPVKISFQKD
jgi:hypothetical protein